jgi:thiol-disulfide isomerase/thioredoxin
MRFTPPPRGWLPRGIFLSGLLLLAWAVHGAELKRVNDAAPKALALKSLDGSVHDLAKYRGKVVLVNFWATWCEPCRDEMPSIERLKEKFAGQPFDVLAVNVDEPEQRVRNFLAKVPLQFTVVLDPGKAVTKDWHVRILPASFLIGRDGRVRYSVVGDLDWSSEANLKIVSSLVTAR